MLARARPLFLAALALLLPLAGLALAAVRYGQGERDDALRLALLALLGICLYGLLLGR